MTNHGKVSEDPLDDPSYQEWLDRISQDCRAEVGNRPCGGCQSGGMCDGDFHSADKRGTDDDHDDYYDEDLDYDDDS